MVTLIGLVFVLLLFLTLVYGEALYIVCILAMLPITGAYLLFTNVASKKVPLMLAPTHPTRVQAGWESCPYTHPCDYPAHSCRGSICNYDPDCCPTHASICADRARYEG